MFQDGRACPAERGSGNEADIPDSRRKLSSLWRIPVKPVFRQGRVHAPAPTRLTRPPVLNWSKGHLSFNGINPSACVPVFRVSDEGGFGRARPLGRAQPVSRVSGKTDRSRGWNKIANNDKTITGKGRFQISTPPHVGKGVGIP